MIRGLTNAHLIPERVLLMPPAHNLSLIRSQIPPNKLLSSYKLQICILVNFKNSLRIVQLKSHL